jgi:DNA-binding GntR family transcriptional regulator
MPSDDASMTNRSPLDEPVRVARMRYVNGVPFQFEQPHMAAAMVRPSDVLAALADEAQGGLAERIADGYARGLDDPHDLAHFICTGEVLR